jgi:sarcosine oxidase
MGEGSFDVIVIGVGGMGSAAAFELARRGRRVLGLEQYAPGHDRGSSHGQTRIIRTAYYEHPAYVPLVRRAFARWYDLEQRQGRHLLTECPLLSIGLPDGEMIRGVRASAAQHDLPVESLSADDLRRRFPPFRVGGEYVGLLERSAGFLAVEECVRAHAREAEKHGAVIRCGEPAMAWRAGPGGVAVQTWAGSYTAARLVLTAGPWAGQMLDRWGASLTVMRQVALWFGVPGGPAPFRRDVFPLFCHETPAGFYYGFPVIDAAGGLKVARHYGAAELPGPDAVDRTVHPADEGPVRAYLRDHLPAADGPLVHASVCLYTLTPDRHFLIDLHPEHPNVVLAAGFSGHGFKFASVVGEILADLADEGRTPLPVEMFRLDRLARGGPGVIDGAGAGG